MEYKDLKKVVELMKDNDLSELKMENEAYKLSLKRGGEANAPVIVQQAAAPQVAAASAPAAIASAPAAAATAVDDGLAEIPSPMVGTFYRAASPEAEAFVSVGDIVDEDTVVCIIEAMKVMNEIKAECKGVIKKSLLDNGDSVEFGQALFKIESA